MTAQILLTKVIDDDDKLSSPSYSFGAIRNESTKWKIHSNKYIIGLSYFLLLSSYYICSITTTDYCSYFVIRGCICFQSTYLSRQFILTCKISKSQAPPDIKVIASQPPQCTMTLIFSSQIVLSTNTIMI